MYNGWHTEGREPAPPHEFTIPLETLPPLENLQSGLPVGGVGGGVRVGHDNDLSAPTPETPQSGLNSAPVFTQSSFTLPSGQPIAYCMFPRVYIHIHVQYMLPLCTCYLFFSGVTHSFYMYEHVYNTM